MLETKNLPKSDQPLMDLDARRQRGLELFCLSFLALFLELMVIRWSPAVVRLIAYYANLMLISSFLGLGVGAILGKKRKSFFAWLPALLLINVTWLLISHFITLPTTATESRFYTPDPQLVRYVCLVGIFLSNAIVFVPLGQRIGSIFEALPPLLAYSWDLGGSPRRHALLRTFLAAILFADAGNGVRGAGDCSASSARTVAARDPAARSVAGWSVFFSHFSGNLVTVLLHHCHRTRR